MLARGSNRPATRGTASNLPRRRTDLASLSGRWPRLAILAAAAVVLLVGALGVSAAERAWAADAPGVESPAAAENPAAAEPEKAASAAMGGEANLILPDLNRVRFLGDSIGGRHLLISGLVVAAMGFAFGLAIYTQIKRTPVHKSMREVSELIYETCKTYLLTQGKFLFVLWLFIGVVITFYFHYLQGYPIPKVAVILICSVVGILGSFGVAWFGIRVNTLANSRTAFAALAGKAFPCYSIPLKAGISIGMLLISVELFLMLTILMFIPGDYAGPCFIGFAIGESLARRRCAWPAAFLRKSPISAPT